MSSPIKVTRQGPILFLNLHTPGSVNTFSSAVAEQIHEIFDSLDPQETKLIVFQSTKPYSFLNGAELVLTQAIQTLEDVHTLTARTKAAFEKVAKCPIPSVAVIEGNCFDCGVEFTLCCDYRIASSSFDTRFYMTELREYPLLPLFGSIEKLPELIGLEPSVNFLLKGEVWDSRTAYESGLIDAVFSAERFSTDVAEFLAHTLKTGPVKRTLRKKKTEKSRRTTTPQIKIIRKRTTDWISKLPPDHQILYRKCMDLLVAATDPEGVLKVQETPSNLLTTLSTEATRKATSFFFVRTMARVASIGTPEVTPKEILEIKLGSPLEPTPFGKVLKERRLKGLRVVHDRTLSSNVSDQISVRDPEKEESFSCQIAWGYSALSGDREHGNDESGHRPDDRNDGQLTVYFPGGEHANLCEAVLPEKSTAGDTHKSFLFLLSQLGWEFIVVEGPGSVLNRYLDLYKKNIDLLSQEEGALARLSHAMWSLGFETSPAETYQRYFGKAPAELEGSHTQQTEDQIGDEDRQILERFLKPLYTEGLQQLESRKLKSRSVIDLIMKSAFGFPVSQGSFCDYMKGK